MVYTNMRESDRDTIKNYYIKHLNLNDIKRVLDIGCGNGTWVIALRELLPSAYIYGIDLSKRAISEAKNLASNAGCDISFSCLDATELSLSSDEPGYDLVIASSSLQYMDRQVFFSLCRKLLNTDGVLLCCNTHTYSYYLSRTVRSLLQFKYKKSIYYAKPLLYTYWKNLIMRQHYGEMFLWAKHIKSHASQEGFTVNIIESLPAYQKTFLGKPIGISFIALKNNNKGNLK